MFLDLHTDVSSLWVSSLCSKNFSLTLFNKASIIMTVVQVVGVGWGWGWRKEVNCHLVTWFVGAVWGIIFFCYHCVSVQSWAKGAWIFRYHMENVWNGTLLSTSISTYIFSVPSRSFFHLLTFIAWLKNAIHESHIKPCKVAYF